MRYLIWLFFPVVLHAQTFQLAPPQIPQAEVFFQDSLLVKLEFDLDQASIHYALGSVPSGVSPVYTHPIHITESTTIRAFTSHPDFRNSAVLERSFIQVKNSPKMIELHAAPHRDYPGKGAISLFDLKKGSADLHDGQWLGFLGDTISMEAVFEQKIHCKNLLISTLNNINAWILPMREIRVSGKNSRGKWVQIGHWTQDDLTPEETPADHAFFQSVALHSMNTRNVRIEIIPSGPLPAGHPGAGQPAWLFMDEIIFQ